MTTGTEGHAERSDVEDRSRYAERAAEDHVPAGLCTQDRLLGERLVLHQFARGHRAGTDGILLAATVPIGARAIADLGAGVGTVGLAAALSEPEARVTLVEREADLVKLARRNIAANQLDARADVVLADVQTLAHVRNPVADETLRTPPAAALRGMFDAILINPPFYDPATRRASPDVGKAGAYMAVTPIAAWVGAAAALARPRAHLAIIHHVEALADLLGALSSAFGGFRILPVQPFADRGATRVLIGARRGGRAPLSLLPPLVLHGPDGRFTADVEAIHRGERRIALFA